MDRWRKGRTKRNGMEKRKQNGEGKSRMKKEEWGK